jgi:hypothetical protein
VAVPVAAAVAAAAAVVVAASKRSHTLEVMAKGPVQTGPFAFGASSMVKSSIRIGERLTSIRRFFAME